MSGTVNMGGAAKRKMGGGQNKKVGGFKPPNQKLGGFQFWSEN